MLSLGPIAHHPTLPLLESVEMVIIFLPHSLRELRRGVALLRLDKKPIQLSLVGSSGRESMQCNRDAGLNQKAPMMADGARKENCRADDLYPRFCLFFFR